LTPVLVAVEFHKSIIDYKKFKFNFLSFQSRTRSIHYLVFTVFIHVRIHVASIKLEKVDMPVGERLCIQL